jgi:hypothetical protein
MPTTAAETEPQNPLRKPRQCRHLKTGGEQCRNRALIGHHFCQSHKFNRHPTFAGVKGYDRVAFLEDHASIQLSLSQVMQGLLDRSVAPPIARTFFYGCSVANATLRDLRAHERWLLEHKLPLPEPVEETVRLDGDELAPDREYRGPGDTFEPQWSFSKFRYEQLCSRLGRPMPTCAADFPASGWLTEDEIAEDPRAWDQRYQARIANLESSAKSAKPKKPLPPSPQASPTPTPNPTAPVWTTSAGAEAPTTSATASRNANAASRPGTTNATASPPNPPKPRHCRPNRILSGQKGQHSNLRSLPPSPNHPSNPPLNPIR